MGICLEGDGFAWALQAVGLEHTTAARAAFLVQATAIMTPLLETATGGRLSRSTWISSGLALVGSVVISTSGDAASVNAPAAQGLEMIGRCTLLSGIS